LGCPFRVSRFEVEVTGEMGWDADASLWFAPVAQGWECAHVGVRQRLNRFFLSLGLRNPYPEIPWAFHGPRHCELRPLMRRLLNYDRDTLKKV